MAKYRLIDVTFWEDQNVEKYTPYQKLVFLLFLTSKNTSESGIYPITIKTISDKTGIPLKNIPSIINGLKNVYYDYDRQFVFVRNFHRRNRHGGNPEKLKRAIENECRQYNTSLWHMFLDAYPEYNYLSDIINNYTPISNTNINTNANVNEPLEKGSETLSKPLGKGLKTVSDSADNLSQFGQRLLNALKQCQHFPLPKINDIVKIQDAWEKLYGNRDIEREILKADSWIAANGRRTKLSFISNWLEKAPPKPADPYENMRKL